MNHEQSTSSMVTTRIVTTHGLTYSLARAIEVTAWQSVKAIYLCCLIHGSCVEVTGLLSLLTTAIWATGKCMSKNMARVLSSSHANST